MGENSVDNEKEGRDWQVGIWDGMSSIYLSEIDRRFIPVVDALIARAGLLPGQKVLDLGCGTGAVALQAAERVAPDGRVTAVDISGEMIALARKRAAKAGLANIEFAECGAESIPSDNKSFDAILASLSLMYVIDRSAAAREIARTLRPGGRFVASVWAGPEECDIVRFQQIAGRFAGPHPVEGVGPGSMADPASFLDQLSASGLQARVETKELGFDFADFSTAWGALARVTTAGLSEELVQDAKDAVLTAMYPNGDGPRHFRNLTWYIIAQAAK